MNLAQSKVFLEKIIALYKNMSADEKNISSIERDLMLNYIRQLYETFIDTPSVVAQPKPVQPVVTPPPPPQPKIEVQAPPPPPPKPVIEEPKPKAVVVETPAPTPPPPPPVVEQPKAYTPPPSTFEAPRYTPPPSSGNVPREIEVLFEYSTGKELSDKLSSMPIADLTKAFGLNDRLLTINELFGGNKAVFDESVKDLNGMSSFETARNYLMNIAVRNNWAANEDRKKQAQVFIKLVRRRFS